MQTNKNKYPIFLLPTDEPNDAAASSPGRDGKTKEGGDKKEGGERREGERGLEEEDWRVVGKRGEEGGQMEEEGDVESCIPGLNNKGKIVNYWLCFILGFGMEFFAFFSHPDKFALWFLLGNIISLGG